MKRIFLTKQEKDILSEKDNNFGNTCFVRNLFEKNMEHQANRLAKETNLTTEELSEIIIDDISMALNSCAR
jgi:hypothetical protein